MKTILVLSILFWAIALPAFGELTDADLDKIRLIVKEEVKTEITAVKQEIIAVRQEIIAVRQELKAEIASSEKRVKEYINIRVDSVEKRLSTYNWGDLRPNASYCRYDRYTHSHDRVAERKGSLTRKTG